MPLSEYLRGVMRHRIVIIALAAFTGIVLTGQAPELLSLVASGATSTFSGSSTVLYFTPHQDTLAAGDTAILDVRVNTNIPINAIGATISFPHDTVEIVGIDKEKSFFDLWTEETVIREDLGEIYFSGGTYESGGLTGIGTILTLKVRAKKAGRAELHFKDTDVYGHDGRGKTVDTEKRSFAYTIGEKSTGSTHAATAYQEIPKPSADFNGDGRVTISDMSILAIQLLAGYNARYDLNLDGGVNLADLSVFFASLSR